MAQYGDQYGHAQNEEFGTQPAQDHGGNVVTQGVGIGATGTDGLSQQLHEQQHGQQEKLHRTGSSSSSSSEDDGEGGRRKNVTEKLKEKIPGVGRKEQQQSQEADGEEGRRKNVTEKIKEKIPGVGKKEQQQSLDTSHDTTGTTSLTGNEVQSHEDKKGVMDKIKDKLSGAK